MNKIQKKFEDLADVLADNHKSISWGANRAGYTPEPWTDRNPDYREMDNPADWRRAVACVNACAGIEHPAEAIEGLKAAAIKVLENGHDIHIEDFEALEDALKAVGDL